VGGGAVLDVELFECRAGNGRETRTYFLALLRREQGFDGPVFVSLEGLDLALTLTNEAKRDRLHAAGRSGAGQLAPEHRRKREANKIVERAARQISFDERRVDGTR